jgi:hypothetical protein
MAWARKHESTKAPADECERAVPLKSNQQLSKRNNFGRGWGKL